MLREYSAAEWISGFGLDSDLLESKSRGAILAPLTNSLKIFSGPGWRAGMILVLTLVITGSGMRPVMAQTPAGASSSRPKRVLMLFNEGSGVQGSITLQQSVQMELQKLSPNPIEFFEEHLYARHFSDLEHFKAFQEYIGRKYAGQNLDLILAFPSGDYALAGSLPDALFPDVPVVFLTVNELDVPYAISKLGVTGIVQRYDIRGTLGLMQRLQPDLHRVVVIGGTSEADRAAMGRIAESASALEGVEFDFWTNRPLVNLTTDVKSLPAGTVILLSSFQRDLFGQPFFMSQLAQLLATVADVPIYSLGSWAMGNGVIGGAVVDSGDLGVRGAQLAFRVLEGVKPETVPIEVAIKGTPMVDWRAVKRWHINESRLPADCVIRYRPVTLWAEHREIILSSLAVFLAQAVTIAGLLAQRKQRRRAESEISRQRTELAHVSRVSTMGQLATAIAHELSQPLGAILRNTEAAELFLNKDKPDLEEIRAILADIRKDDQRAGSVIDRMRALLKRRELVLKPLILAELIEETVALARSDALARRVTLTMQVAAELPKLRGDRVHLQQVLLNLILNAMDAMAEDANDIRTLVISAGLGTDGMAEIAVSDCGSGIPVDKMQSLFEPFFTTKPNGLGMGLAISRTLIEAHGGKIWAENNPGRGATFKFTLPVERRES